MKQTLRQLSRKNVNKQSLNLKNSENQKEELKIQQTIGSKTFRISSYR